MKKKHKKRIRISIAWFLVVLWAGVIFYASSRDGRQLDDGEGFIGAMRAWLVELFEGIAGHHVDVSPLGHFGEYGIFGLLLCWAFFQHMKAKKAWKYSWASVAFYGLTDEFHQIFVPGRTADILDWCVDMCGSGAGILVFLGILSLISRKR